MPAYLPRGSEWIPYATPHSALKDMLFWASFGSGGPEASIFTRYRPPARTSADGQIEHERTREAGLADSEALSELHDAAQPPLDGVLNLDGLPNGSSPSLATPAAAARPSIKSVRPDASRAFGAASHYLQHSDNRDQDGP